MADNEAPTATDERPPMVIYEELRVREEALREEIEAVIQVEASLAASGRGGGDRGEGGVPSSEEGGGAKAVVPPQAALDGDSAGLGEAKQQSPTEGEVAGGDGSRKLTDATTSTPIPLPAATERETAVTLPVYKKVASSPYAQTSIALREMRQQMGALLQREVDRVQDERDDNRKAQEQGGEGDGGDGDGDDTGASKDGDTSEGGGAKKRKEKVDSKTTDEQGKKGGGEGDGDEDGDKDGNESNDASEKDASDSDDEAKREAKRKNKADIDKHNASFDKAVDEAVDLLATHQNDTSDLEIASVTHIQELVRAEAMRRVDDATLAFGLAKSSGDAAAVEVAEQNMLEVQDDAKGATVRAQFQLDNVLRNEKKQMLARKKAGQKNAAMAARRRRARQGYTNYTTFTGGVRLLASFTPSTLLLLLLLLMLLLLLLLLFP